MDSQPVIYVIAGPNGIGKTTSDFDLVPGNIPVINSDEIAYQVKNSGLMNVNKQSIRKPVRLPEKAASQPLSSLREAFKTFQLDELKKELKRWLYVAISNNNSVYEDDLERRNLIRFRKEFRKLLESLSVINKAHRPKKEMDWLTRMAPELKRKLKSAINPPR